MSGRNYEAIFATWCLMALIVAANAVVFFLEFTEVQNPDGLRQLMNDLGVADFVAVAAGVAIAVFAPRETHS